MIPGITETENKVYISGPITGQWEGNRLAFLEAEHTWMNRGWIVCNPRELNPAGTSWKNCMLADLKELLTCNAVAVLPGWRNSKGACLEVHIAERLEMPVYEADTGVLVNFTLPIDEPEAITQEAHRIVHGPRRGVYGHPLDDYTKTSKLFSGILGVDVTPEQAILCMIAVKMSRLVQSPDHRDSIVDIAGYAECLDLVRQERIKRGLTTS